MSVPSKAAARSPAPVSDVRVLLADLVRALDAKKAENLQVLSVGEHSSITDYLILASGQANPHLRALRVEAERVLDAAGAPIAGIESGEGSGWIVFDAYQIMIHLFMPEQRENYQLEQLWRDADVIAVEDLLAPAPAPAPVAKKKTVTKKAAPKKAAAKKVTAKKAVAKKTAPRKKSS